MAIEDAVEVLENLEPVRRRPGMYVGDVHDGSGLLHMLWEVVGNVIDLHLARRALHLRVDLGDGEVEVEDDGPGMPLGIDPRTGKTAMEVVFTTLCSWPTWDGHFPHVHIGHRLLGMGIGPVNALCEELEVETRATCARS